MLETVGKTLTKARHSKQLTIEDAEHETCIPHDRIRELEDDDYSHFANLTYAKSFLKLYSDYLGVDTSEYRQELSLYEVDDFGSDPLSNEFAEEDEPKKNPQIFARLVLFLLVAALGAFVYVEFFDQRNPTESEGGSPNLAKIPDEGQDVPAPGAKPPGGIPDKATPDPLETKPPEPSEVIPPKENGETEFVPSLPIPDDAERVKVGGEELPVLPAVVIEDDELLGSPPTTSEESAPGGSGDGSTEEEPDSPEVAATDGETGQEEPEDPDTENNRSEESDATDGDATDGDATDGDAGDGGNESEEPMEVGPDGSEPDGSGSGESGIEESESGESEGGSDDPEEGGSEADESTDTETEESGAGESEPEGDDPGEGDPDAADPTEAETETGEED